jgi:hypothetical protein
MSDLPERIWVDGVFHVWKYDPAPAIGYKEYLRSDLSAPVGFSREQMADAFDAGNAYDGSIEREFGKFMATLTPAAKDPEVLVEALERIANQYRESLAEIIAREALDVYNKGIENGT